jgi:hypothetical protein
MAQMRENLRLIDLFTGIILIVICVLAFGHLIEHPRDAPGIFFGLGVLGILAALVWCWSPAGRGE